MNLLIESARDIITGKVVPTSEELIKILEYASELYYNDGNSFLTDEEYDLLESILKNVDPTSEYLLKVGSNVRTGKVTLPCTMGSLDQVYDGDAERWIIQKQLINHDIVLSDKLDGISGLLVYDSLGRFSVAYSRGNGIEGADITRHIKRMKHVPKRVSEEMMVRVEIIIPNNTFPKLQKLIEDSSGKFYKNSRNYVAGKMNASNVDDLFVEHAHVVVTSVVSPNLSKIEQFEKCRKEGFLVTEYSVIKGKDINDELLKKYLDSRRNETKYEIDGIVLDINNKELRKNDSSNLNPSYAKKFKTASSDNVAITNVLMVHYEPSKAGFLKPRIEIEPVELMGVKITYTTGFNCKFIQENGIGPGAVIEITRSGDVIPYIKRVITPVTPQLPDENVFGKMQWTKGKVDLFLLNPNHNKNVIINKLVDTFSQLSVPALRKGNIEKLVDAGLVSSVDIIKATKEQLQTILGNSAGEKVFDGIKEKLNPVKYSVLASASLTLGRGIGEKKLSKLLSTYNTINNLTIDDIIKIEGFEKTTAELIYNNKQEFLNFLQEIEGFYTLEENNTILTPSTFNICFTGIRDKELENIITKHGGRITSNINKDLNILVCKDLNSTSSKMSKAKSLGIEIIDINEAKSRWA